MSQSSQPDSAPPNTNFPTDPAPAMRLPYLNVLLSIHMVDIETPRDSYILEEFDIQPGPALR